jgi:hypothetical protein
MDGQQTRRDRKIPARVGSGGGGSTCDHKVLARIDGLTAQVSQLATENAELRSMLIEMHAMLKRTETSMRTPELSGGADGAGTSDMISSDAPTPDSTTPETKPWREVEANIDRTTMHGELSPNVVGEIRETLRRTAVHASLGKHALIPYAECLEAAGISREVGDRLREEGALEPITVADSKNPRLYITAGAWADFIRRCKVAPPPSKSKLSRAKKAKKRSRG